MPTYTYRCTVEWTGAASGPTIDPRTFSRDTRVAFADHAAIDLSAAPEFQGNPDRTNPEELFVASLAGCQMLTYLYLAARNGVRVLAYTDDAQGELALRDGRLRITHVTLRPHITISPESNLQTAQALIDRAHDDCFIASSVTTAITIEPEIGALH